MEIGLQNQFNVGLIPILLSGILSWKVSITGNAAVLKTAVRITAFAGSSPAPSALPAEALAKEVILSRSFNPFEKPGRSKKLSGHYNT
jgi:hypothetical protein